MKLAVSTYSLGRWMRENNKTLNDAIDWIADHAGGIEFSGLDVEEGRDPIRRANVVRRRCERRNLKIVNYGTGAELIHAHEADQRQVIDRVKREVEVAAALGAKNMRHDITRGFPKKWTGPRTFTAAVKHVVPAVREIADFAQTLGVRTTMENHGFYTQAPDRVEKLIRAVNHPNFALTIDIGNFLCVNADPVQAVRRLAPYASHAHIKDFHIKPKAQAPKLGWIHTPTRIAIRGAIVGHGDVDLESCLRILHRSGYRGWLGLEFEGLEEPAFAVEQGLAEAKRLLRQARSGR